MKKRLRKSLLMMIICLALTILAIPTVTYADFSQDTIKQVQTKLNELGYDCGAPDGIAGQHTIEAVQKYQAEKGLEVTNEINEELLSSLGMQDINIPGISVSAFVDRYNTAINEYNQIAERDGYTKAKTISGLSSGTHDYKPDGDRAGIIKLNDGEKNDYDKVGSFSIYCLTDGWYDKALFTGQIISCIYAFDESLSSFYDAGNLYSQLMESNNDSLSNGDISYYNSSISGFVHISGKVSGFEAAIEKVLAEEADKGAAVSDENDIEQSQIIGQEGIIIKTPEDINSLFSTVIGEKENFENIFSIELDNYSSNSESDNTYNINNSIFLDYPCSIEIEIKNDNIIKSIYISFDEQISKADYDKLSKAVDEGLKTRNPEVDEYDDHVCWKADSCYVTDLKIRDDYPSYIYMYRSY